LLGFVLVATAQVTTMILARGFAASLLLVLHLSPSPFALTVRFDRRVV
jgi:hypothetical protein